jgi:hypothetical protein
MIMRILQITFSLLPGLLCLLIACSEQQFSGDRSERDSGYIPDSEVTGATYYLYEKGKVTTRILADSTRTFNSLDSTMAYDLDIYFLNDSGKVTSNLVADSGIIREQAAIHHIYGNLVYEDYDSLGNLSTHLVGDSGVITEQDRIFEIFGHVIATSQQKRRLETDYLRWRSKTDKVDTPSDVEFTKSDGTVIRGRGFEADRGLSRARILSRVSGTWVETEEPKRDAEGSESQ